MKVIIFAVCMCIVSASFAAQTNTECPGMKDTTKRDNPKANMSVKPKQIKTEETSAQ